MEKEKHQQRLQVRILQEKRTVINLKKDTVKKDQRVNTGTHPDVRSSRDRQVASTVTGVVFIHTGKAGDDKRRNSETIAVIIPDTQGVKLVSRDDQTSTGAVQSRSEFTLFRKWKSSAIEKGRVTH